MAGEEQSNITNIDLESNPLKENGNSEIATSAPLELSEERKAELENDMAKLEDEINTLRQAMFRKEKQLADIRAELGITRWTRIQNSEAVNKSKQALAEASKTTSQALREIGTATANKWTEIRESPRYQTVSEKFWSTTESVKAKLVGEKKTIEHEPHAAQIVVTPENEIH